MGLYKRGETWWCSYRYEGERYFESTKTADKRAAQSIYTDRKRNGPPREQVKTAPVTLDAFLDAWLARRRSAGVRIVGDETQWMRDYVRPVLGARVIGTITRAEVRDLIAGLSQSTTSKKTGKRLAARSVLHVYRTLALAFSDAVADGVVVATPCTLKTRKGELPRKKDSDPAWRAQAVYTREEAERLLTHREVPADRRAYYALMLLAGLRASEACGRRWVDYDAKAQPLGRLTVATQADGAHELVETKTGEVREVPVVPALASILDDWKRTGFPALFGRHPQPEDPIVPTRSDPTGRSFRQATMMHQRCGEDRKRIELRAVPHAQHAMRATFLTLLESVGANMAIARRATHAASGDVVAGYIRTSWADLCREVGKLPIDLSPGAEVIHLLAARTGTDANENGDSGGDNRSAPSEVPMKKAANAWAQLDSKRGPIEKPRHATGSDADKHAPSGPVNTRSAADAVQTVTRVTDPSVSDTIARLRAMGFHEAADALEREKR